MQNQINVHNSSSYLSFVLNNESFAVSVSHVLEIMEMPMLTEIPNASRYIKGVLNFRGEIVPVINMHERFNLVPQEEQQKMVIIIDLETQESSLHLGLLVNEVNQVIDFELKDIRSVPDMGIQFDMRFLNGIVDVNNQFLMVLDLNKVLYPEELAQGSVA